MVEMLLFHHAQGLTRGILELADGLRAVGHVVHTPDLYDGRTFATLAEGVDHAESLGFGLLLERARREAEPLPPELVYAGCSLGVLPAQMLAQTRAGARGALLFHACVPPSEFGEAWPEGVPVQVHAMDADPFFVGDGDLEAARALTRTTTGAELFLYPGDRHLFADPSLSEYDSVQAELLTRRVLAFLEAIDSDRRRQP